MLALKLKMLRGLRFRVARLQLLLLTKQCLRLLITNWMIRYQFFMVIVRRKLKTFTCEGRFGSRPVESYGVKTTTLEVEAREVGS